MSESGFSMHAVTEAKSLAGVREVQATSPPSGEKTITSSVAIIQGSTVSAMVPDLRAPSGVAADGFVYRIGPGATVVKVKLDTQQVQERQLVRMANEALRRSTQG